MKKLLSVFALCIGLCGTAQAQIPVTDGAHIMESVIGHVQEAASWIKQIADMKMQYDQMVQQYEQAKQTYASLNGIRGMADLVNNPLARQYLPDTASGLLSQGNGLSASVEQIKKAAQLMDASKLANATSQAAKSMQASQKKIAGMQASASKAYDEAGKRFATIQVLLDKVNDAPDAKAIEDLQARIQAEQVMMQNETAKLAMMKQVQEAEWQVELQAGREKAARLGAGKPIYLNQ